MKTTFNTILFGNGLTTALFNQIRVRKLAKRNNRLLNINDNICSLIGAPVDSPVYRRVLPLFGVFNHDTPNYQNMIAAQRKSKLALMPLIPEIRKSGMEHTIGNHLFDRNTNLPGNIMFLYILYNFWYQEIEESLLSKPTVIEFLQLVADELTTQFDAILTLNFDLLLDNRHMVRPLDIQHIHGRFVEKLSNYGDLQLFLYNDGEQFEYPYLFGSNAFEKMNRLKHIDSRSRRNSSYYYNLDFLFNDDRDWGNLLVYGISFFSTSIFPEEFFAAFPEYRNPNKAINYYFTNSLDGHILYRLQSLLEEGKIQHLIIAYYSKEDRKQYEKLLSKTTIAEHLSLIPFSDVPFTSKLKSLLGISRM